MKQQDTLLHRIETLEKSNKTLRSAVAVAIAGFSLVVLMGAAAAQQKLEANKIVFRDNQGRIRITLDNAPSGPVCTISSVTGQPGIRFFISNDGFVQFEDPSKKKAQ